MIHFTSKKKESILLSCLFVMSILLVHIYTKSTTMAELAKILERTQKLLNDMEHIESMITKTAKEHTMHLNSVLVEIMKKQENNMTRFEKPISEAILHQKKHAAQVEKKLLDMAKKQEENINLSKTTLKAAKELRGMSSTTQEALVEILDSTRYNKHFLSYDAHRTMMKTQLQVITDGKNNVEDMQSKYILLDNVQIDMTMKYKIIIMVFSHSLNFDRRTRIRQLWGNSSIWRTKEKFKVIFLLGGIFDQSLTRKIYMESQIHRDLILESIPEGYFTTSSKLGICLHWLSLKDWRFEFVMKTDDDVFVHVDNVMKKLNHKKYKAAHFFGNLTKNPRPLREGRYKITTIEYPSNSFPEFFPGAGVFLSKFLLTRIAPHFEFVNPLKLEDVYLAEVVLKYGGGIKPIPCDGYDFYNQKCTYDKDLLFLHPAKTEECMKKLTQIAVSEVVGNAILV